MNEQKFILIGAGVAALVLIYMAKNPTAAANAGQAVGEAAAAAAGGVVAGAAEGIGDQIGLPRTNADECQKALDEGRYWDASFVCPAGTFIGGAADGVKTTLSDIWDKL